MVWYSVWLFNIIALEKSGDIEKSLIEMLSDESKKAVSRATNFWSRNFVTPKNRLSSLKMRILCSSGSTTSLSNPVSELANSWEYCNSRC